MLHRTEDTERLSRIATMWDMLRQANEPADADASHAAQRVLMERYCTSVHRYLLGALRDEDAADELFQEFALRFLRGDFKRIDAKRGRFRDYVRTVLIHLVNDHHRARKRNPQALPADVAAPASDPPAEDHHVIFVESWRTELMNHAWTALEKTQPAYYAVLLFHVQNPQVESAQAAEELSARLRKRVSATNLRVMLHRARERFAELLLAEVARSLESPTDEELAAELKLLNLHKVCDVAMLKQPRRKLRRPVAMPE